jgi:putative intracellular protease/amidase
MRLQELSYSFALFSTVTPCSATFSKNPPPLPANTYFPRHFGIVVWPSFAGSDIFGPISVLDGLGFNYPELGMHLSVLSTTLEPVSTRLLNGVSNRTNLFSDYGFSIVPTDTLDAVLARSGKTWVDPYPPAKGQEDGANVTKTLSQLEVLIVPGGGTSSPNRAVEIDFIKQLYPNLKVIVSVCTGAKLLSQSGILDGRKATSNKFSLPSLKENWPKVQWVDRARWVQDGNIWTGSGPSAGADVMYAWAESVFGKEVADWLAARVEQVRWSDSAYDPFADIWE